MTAPYPSIGLTRGLMLWLGAPASSRRARRAAPADVGHSSGLAWYIPGWRPAARASSRSAPGPRTSRPAGCSRSGRRRALQPPAEHRAPALLRGRRAGLAGPGERRAPGARPGDDGRPARRARRLPRGDYQRRYELRARARRSARSSSSFRCDAAGPTDARAGVDLRVGDRQPRGRRADLPRHRQPAVRRRVVVPRGPLHAYSSSRSPGAVLGGVVLALRYRRLRAEGRLQVRWPMYGGFAALVLGIEGAIVAGDGHPARGCRRRSRSARSSSSPPRS